MSKSRSRLMAQLIDAQTGEVHKVYGCRWISAAHYKVLVDLGDVEPAKYIVKYSRMEY